MSPPKKMYERIDPRPGLVCWCDTSRSSIGMVFSDKERRPVLVVELLQGSDYAAVYPCTRNRAAADRCDWLDDVLVANTYVLYGEGLFYVPRADLSAPAAYWPRWPAWRRTNAALIAQHRHALMEADGEHIYACRRASGGTGERMESSLAERLGALELKRLEEILARPEPAPAPPRPLPRPAPPTAPPPDPFLAALDSLPPEAILESVKNDGAAAEAATRSQGRKNRSRKPSRRQ